MLEEKFVEAWKISSEQTMGIVIYQIITIVNQTQDISCFYDNKKKEILICLKTLDYNYELSKFIDENSITIEEIPIPDIKNLRKLYFSLYN